MDAVGFEDTVWLLLHPDLNEGGRKEEAGGQRRGTSGKTLCPLDSAGQRQQSS